MEQFKVNGEIEKITIRTAVSESTVFCGNGAFILFADEYGGRSEDIFLITDSNVDGLYAKLISETFARSKKYVIPAGEKSKNYHTLIYILKAMVEGGMLRSSTVVALGGGVVGDIAGLAASLYMRGVNFIQIPTTLLAQVDSSVGGKTAIDMDGIKNVIGTFYQASRVYADPMFLNTLPQKEIRCGLGEIIKYGALYSPVYRSLLLNAIHIDRISYLKKLIATCIGYKTKVVCEDEKEVTGARKALNMGHTTGHAFELYYMRRSHGDFVLIGMYYELYIAERLGVCTDKKYADSLRYLIKKALFRFPVYDDVAKAAELACHDKKNVGRGEVSLIAPKSEGEYAEIKLPKDEYISLISDCGAEIEKTFGKKSGGEDGGE